ncbi:MAG: aldo/keto reductase [Acidobacteria bacterium]|nr:aldo/keto reductase [Acidobacteriota bacterium]
MQRRTFLGLSAAALAADVKLLAQAPMPMATLGKSGLRISRFCVGGYHMAVGGEEMGVRIIHRAMDLGVNFFDCAWLYHNGRSDEVYGKALGDGRRQKVLVMGKAHDRTRDGAMKQLEDTLRRMKTDYLDLWQCHQVTEQQEVDQILGPGGALETFVKAKQQGKVRHIGFTGHADPAVHQRLLDSFDGWETVQHPVNLIDPHYLSFINSVLPNIRKKGLGLLAMKSNGMGSIGKASIAPIAECLRFSWSHDVDVVVSGVETVEQLEQNVAVLKTLKPMSKAEIAAVLARTAKGPHGVQVERYKRKPAASGAVPAHRDGEPA